LRKPLLLLHSPQDEVVPISNAQEIYQAAFHPKSFISLDKADHLLSRQADAEYGGRVIAEWAGRYLEAADTAGGLPKGWQVATRNTDYRYATDIQSGRHALIGDEPERVGGNDLGPSPYEYLLSGLGACTSMTLQMYAEHKKLPLHDIEVLLKHEKRKTEPNENGGTQKYDHITRLVRVDGDFEDELLPKLKKIADKCPVHKTLESSGVVVETQIERLDRSQVVADAEG
jgi:putative redox protein